MVDQINSDEIKSLKEGVAKLTQASEDLTKEYRNTFEKWQREVKAGTSETEVKRLSDQLSAEVLPKLAANTALTDRINEIEKRAKLTQDAVAKIEAMGARSTASRSADEIRNLGALICEHPRYKSFIENLAVNEHAGFSLNEILKDTNKSALGSFWNRREVKAGRTRGMEVKAPGEWAGSNVSAGVYPMYRPDIVETPRRIPVLRSLVPVVPTTSTDSVISTREVTRRRLFTLLDGAVASGNSSFVVDNIEGFSSVAPFNTLTLDNGSATESLTIQSVTRATRTIVTTANSTINMADNDKIYASNIIITAEGYAAPSSLVTLANYTVPICRLTTNIKASLEKLRDIATAEDYINRHLMDLMVDAEDTNFLYGPGGSSPNKIKGLFVDSDVTTATRTGSTTALDHILSQIYALANNNYIPTATLVSVNTHKTLAQLKDSTGNYLLWMSQGNGGMADRLNITRLVMTNMLQSAHGVVADWTRACTIYDREAAEITVHEVGNDALEHQRTLLAGERVGFGIERPSGVICMSF